MSLTIRSISNDGSQPEKSAFRTTRGHRRAVSSPDEIILSGKVSELAQVKIGASGLTRRSVSPFHVSRKIITLIRLLPKLIPPAPNKPLPPTPDELSDQEEIPPVPEKPLSPIPGCLEQVFRKQFLPREHNPVLDSIPESVLEPLPSPSRLEQRFKRESLPKEHKISLDPVSEEGEIEEEVGSDAALKVLARPRAEKLSVEAERRVEEYLLELSKEAPVVKSGDSQESCSVEINHEEYIASLKSGKNKKTAKISLKCLSVILGIPIVTLIFHGVYEGYRALRNKPYDILVNEEKIEDLRSKIDSAGDRIADIDKKLEQEIDSHLTKAMTALKEANEEYKGPRAQKRALNSARVQKESEVSSLKKKLGKLAKEQKDAVEKTGVIPPLPPEAIALNEQISVLNAEIINITFELNRLQSPLSKMESDIEKEAMAQVLEEIRNNPKIRKRLDSILRQKEKVKRHLDKLNEDMVIFLEEGQEILKRRKLRTLAEKNLTFRGVQRDYLQARQFRSSLEQRRELGDVSSSYTVSPKQKRYFNQLPLQVQNRKLRAIYEDQRLSKVKKIRKSAKSI